MNDAEANPKMPEANSRIRLTWIIAQTFAHSGWSSIKYLPANCPASASNRHPGKFKLMFASTKSFCALEFATTNDFTSTMSQD